MYKNDKECFIETEVTFEDGKKGKISADLKVYDMEVFDCERISSHGGSIRVYVALKEKFTKSVPLRRFADPSEMSEGALFILRNAYYTGRTLEIDGGVRICYPVSHFTTAPALPICQLQRKTLSII